MMNQTLAPLKTSFLDSQFQIRAVANSSVKIVFNAGNMISSAVLTIDAGSQTTTRTLSVPVLVSNDTIATLAVPNAFTSSITVIDGDFSILGSSDATKKMAFEVDSQTTGKTLTIATGAQTVDRTLSVPVLSANDTIAVLGLSNAFTDTTDSTSPTTGSIKLTGGLGFGVTKSIFGGGFKSTSATLGIGYATGAGGAVTQATSRATGVTLSTATGKITMFTAAGSATPATFVVTNTAVAATDSIVINDVSGSTNVYFWKATPAAGSFTVTFWTTGGTASDTPVIQFGVLKGAIS